MYALDLHTHRLRWSKHLGAKITSSAAIAGGTLFVGDYDGRLWALVPRTGATRWVGRVNGKIYGTPAVSHGRVFVPPRPAYSLTAFSTQRPRPLARHRRLLRLLLAGRRGRRVCFGSYDGYFYCLSAASGRVLWRVYAGGPISGAATVSDGVAYAGSFAHRILGVNAPPGRVLMTFPHGEFVPVSGNGSRLLFNGFSRIYAVEPRRAAPAALMSAS